MNLKNIQLTAEDLLPLLVKWTGRLRELRDGITALPVGTEQASEWGFEELLQGEKDLSEAQGALQTMEECHDNLAKFLQNKIKEFNSAKTAEWMDVVHGPRIFAHVE